MPERKSSFMVMPPVSSVLGNCVVGRGGIKASPSAACVRDANCDGLAKLASFRKSSDTLIRFSASL